MSLLRSWTLALGILGCTAARPHAGLQRSSSCPTTIPPVELRLGSVDSATVCRLVIAVKHWISTSPSKLPGLVPADSGRIRTINVVRNRVGDIPPGEPVDSAHARWHWVTRIEADVPGQPRLIVAALDDAADTIAYYVVHRGPM